MTARPIRLSLLAAMIAAAVSPVYAADASRADETGVPASGAAAAADQAAPSPDGKKDGGTDVTNLQGITVTASIADSLKSAQTIKQDSRMIVDAIVAEDIGKLPDVSVADALQRITGVQVAPGRGGETSSVVIRGLPNVITTLNGNEIFDETGRGFAFQNLPATAVRALEVYKTSDASQPVGGIAGVVNIVLFRPFDFDGAQVAGTLTETDSHIAGHTDPNGSLLLSDRWDTPVGELGALANVAMSAQHYNSTKVWNFIPQTLNDSSGNPIRTADGNLVAVPQNIGSDYSIGYRTRPEFNYAVQWKPNDTMEAYVTGLYTWFSDRNNDSFFLSQPQNQPGAPSTPVTNLQVGNHCYANQQPGPYLGQTICDATSATFSGDTFTLTSPHAQRDWGKDIQNSIGFKWHDGPLKLSTDFTQTVSTGHFEMLGLDTFLKGPVTTQWQVRNGVPSWSLVGNPQLDPSQLYLNGLFGPWNVNHGTENAWRADGRWDFHAGPLTGLEFGVRYADHTADSIGGNVLPNGNGYIGPPGGAGDGNIVATPNPDNQYLLRFPQSSLCRVPGHGTAQPYLSTCLDYLLQHANDIRGFYGLAPGLGPANPGSAFNIEEKRPSVYLQATYDTELFGIPVGGVVGIRGEHLDRDLSASAFNAADSTYTPVNLSTSGNTYLPNFSSIFQFSDTLQGRVLFSKTITYPDFASLNPALTFTPPTLNSSGSGSSGNPFLTPVTSKNGDASLEWYFSDVGSLTGGVFYRDIKGYQENFQTLQTVQGYPIFLNQPESAGSGHLWGGEFAYQQKFSFLPGPWDGLGTQLNFTYIQGSTLGQTVNGIVASTPIQNVSRDNYNAVLFYEKYGFSARLAYTFRSRFIEGFAPLNTGGFYHYAKVPNQLDFSVSYDINKHTTVVLEGTNLTSSKGHEYWNSGDYTPDSIYFQDRTVAVGIRFKL